MKTVKIIKEGFVRDFGGKLFDLSKLTNEQAEHLIREGCTDIEIVEDNETGVDTESQNTEGVRSISAADETTKTTPVVELDKAHLPITEGGKVKVPTSIAPVKTA